MKQKLHLLTLAKKEFSAESLRYILLSKENTVVCNASALVAHDSTEIFDKEFVESIPEGEWLLPSDASKEMNRFPYHIEGTALIVTGKTKMVYDMIKNNTNGIKYPDWKCVIPEKFGNELGRIGFSPELLERLRAAINPDTRGVELSFVDENHAVGVRAVKSDIVNYKAVIMPIMLDY